MVTAAFPEHCPVLGAAPDSEADVCHRRPSGCNPFERAADFDPRRDDLRLVDHPVQRRCAGSAGQWLQDGFPRDSSLICSLQQVFSSKLLDLGTLWITEPDFAGKSSEYIIKLRSPEDALLLTTPRYALPVPATAFLTSRAW